MDNDRVRQAYAGNNAEMVSHSLGYVLKSVRQAMEDISDAVGTVGFYGGDTSRLVELRNILGEFEPVLSNEQIAWHEQSQDHFRRTPDLGLNDTFTATGTTQEPAPKLDLGDTFPLTEQVMWFNEEDILVRMSYVDGKPNTVEEFGAANGQWGRSMSVLAGSGKTLHDALVATPRDARRVPEEVARAYGKITGKCLMCGRSLSSEESLAAGYGPECRGKLR
ncbi:MAG: hypothetical protein E6R04_03490 [Spirochaetes bacterium]|nr:MAG: hypothetical protein E6R04_03490 [Spirochaetota bacterium]